ncbi:hypothetical protein ACFWBR_41290 [Streptomyces sp. NPDC060006]|uniref:hypothetical protein n=1 Tax=Streptomyces sp. NPDC060006 TaxID=3347035 RepID=UPI003688D39D
MTPKKVFDPEMKGGLQLGFGFDEPETAVPVPAPICPQPVMAGPRTALQPMSTAAAEWIAQHVIADYHLANEKTWGDPDQNWEPRCRCQLPCTLCRMGNHARCSELRNGVRALFDPQPETHLRAPAPYSPQRAKLLHTAVWLADRACRALCDCPQCTAVPTTVACLKDRRDELADAAEVTP